MTDIDCLAVIADLEERGNAILAAARTLREIYKPTVMVRVPVTVKKFPDISGQIVPMSESIRKFIDGTRTAIQIADAVELLYPDRDRDKTRQHVSTQLSAWQREGSVRKDEQGRISMVNKK